LILFSNTPRCLYIYEASLYAKDPIREVSAIVLFIPGTGLGCSRHHGRRKVFPLGRTAWRDDKNLSHMFVTGILRERMLLPKQISEKYGEY
jgi:hypothetical protein